MPTISSLYKSPIYLRNGHAATIVPSMFRKVRDVEYIRERINTPDDDFLDLDWVKNSGEKLLVISHGLEGSSHRPYVKGMVKYFSNHGWDVLAWNCRSCGGEINRKGRFYHHGETGDLALVLNHAANQKEYTGISLAGFSMGGSMTLKFLGERKNIGLPIRSAITFSVPVDLKSSVDKFGERYMAFYRDRFLKKLEDKVKRKAELYPNEIEYYDFSKINYFPDFDRLYTAPLHGFKDEWDFYSQASAKRYMPNINVPTLLVNAMNDPFLPKECYPYDLANLNHNVILETPQFGGHVGFVLKNNQFNYMEIRGLDFVNHCELN